MDLHKALKLIAHNSDKEKRPFESEPIWQSIDFLQWGVLSETIQLLAAGFLERVNNSSDLVRITHAGRVQLTRWNDGKFD